MKISKEKFKKWGKLGVKYVLPSALGFLVRWLFGRFFGGD